MKIIDTQTGKTLTPLEILDEANRDHSDEWQDYTLQDLKENPNEVMEWIDTKYFEVQL